MSELQYNPPNFYDEKNIETDIQKYQKQYAIALNKAIEIAVLNPEKQIRDYENTLLFESQTAFKDGKINKLFRAIVLTGATPADIAKHKKNIEVASKMLNYLYKIRTYLKEKQEPPQHLKPAEGKLPVVFPRFIDSDIVKVRVTIYKSHKSERFNNGFVNIALYKKKYNLTKAELNRLSKKERERVQWEEERHHDRFIDFARQLEKEGYEPQFNESNDEIDISVNSLLKKHNCDSIQRRNETGRQIRAEFYKYDEKGFLLKSKRESVGVLLIPYNMEVEVLESDSRRIREDNLYTAGNEREIILDEEYSDFMTCRLYKNYD